MEEIRDNIVHVLGTFIDDASSLREYREMIANLGAAQIEVDANTGFIVMPWFSGGDLCKCIAQKKESGESFSERTILEYMSQILDAIHKLQRVGNTHRDLKPDNIFLTGGADGVAIADFGELGDVQLRFTKGETQAGGAPGFIAPDVLETIERMGDGTTATIDYSKNDVFAAGLIFYKMVMADNDAEPWDEGASRTAATMRRIPDGRCSDGLKALIEDMLNPSFAARVDAQSASARVMEMQYNDRPGGASQINERVERQVRTPRGGADDVSRLMEVMSGSVSRPIAESALRHSSGNVQRAAEMLLLGEPIPEGEPPPHAPPNADAVAALTAAFAGLPAAAASRALEEAGGDPESAAGALRAQGFAGPPPPQEVDELAKAELLQYGFPEAHVVQALVEAGGNKERAIDICLSMS